MRTIGFLGLGTMGSGMARRLLGAGFQVHAYNRTASRAETLAAEGANFAATPREAAAAADVVISMLADDKASRSAWLGENGALGATRPGTICIESSTLSVAWIKELSSHVEARDGRLLDAPVTGSKPQAHSGELLFLVGGDAKVFESAREIFRPMSRGAVYLGPAGSGALMKLINNFVCGVQVASLAEAMGMIEASGLDRGQALEVLSNGAPGSPLLRTVSGRMAGREYTPNFAVNLMAKDLSYAIEEARRLSIDLETAQAGRKLFQAASAAGWGEQDIAAVMEPFRVRRLEP